MKTLKTYLEEKGFVHEEKFGRWKLEKLGVKPIYVTDIAVQESSPEILASVDRMISEKPYELHKGDHVIFVDAKGQEHDALVTEVFGSETWTRDYEGPCINVVFVSTDENRTDQYGRQLERVTSVVPLDRQFAKGMYWKLTA